jgi:hypothetical protein
LCLGPERTGPERQLWRKVDEKEGVAPFERSPVSEKTEEGNI